MDQAAAALLEELEANRAMFGALCRACSEEWLARPLPGGRWTVGDHIAHIGSYDQLAVHHLSPPAARDSLMEGAAALATDAWNEIEVQRRAGMGRATLLAEMAERRAESLRLLGGLAAADLQRDVYFPGDAQRTAGTVPLRLWLQRWSKHDMLHALAMLRAIPELEAHPDFQAWLADDPLLEAVERQQQRQPGPQG